MSEDSPVRHQAKAVTLDQLMNDITVMMCNRRCQSDTFLGVLFLPISTLGEESSPKQDVSRACKSIAQFATQQFVSSKKQMDCLFDFGLDCMDMYPKIFVVLQLMCLHDWLAKIIGESEKDKKAWGGFLKRTRESYTQMVMKRAAPAALAAPAGATTTTKAARPLPRVAKRKQPIPPKFSGQLENGSTMTWLTSVMDDYLCSVY